MRMNLIIETPATLLIDDAWVEANPGAAYELYRIDAEWVSRQMPDTKEIAGKKLIQVSIDINGTDPTGLLEGLLTIYDLPWTLLGMQSMYGQPHTDLEGNITYAALTYKPINLSVLDYINDRHTYDTDGNITGTLAKELNWIPTWAGAAEWR